MPAASVVSATSAIKPMRDDLAHHIRQRFAAKRRDRHPAHACRCAGPRGHMRGIDHKFERKVRKDMSDHAHLAMPARHATEPGCLLQRGLVVLRSVPVRTRHFGHAAEQSLFGATANQQLAAARHDKGSTSAKFACLLRSFARKALLIAALTRPAGIREWTEAARRPL